MRRTSTCSVITSGSSSSASVTTASSYITSGYDTILEFVSDINEYIATEDALDIDGDGGDRYIEGDYFELHMNAN